jgi:Methyltransferase domain
MATKVQHVEQTSAQTFDREPVTCHTCGCVISVPFLEARGYTVVKCRGCGLLFINPQPGDAELVSLYASHDQGDQWRIHEDRFNRAISREILRVCRSGSVLGFSVSGIERSESGWRYASQVHGIEIFHGSVEDFLRASAERSFDVITLLNVLEHVKHPRVTLVSLAGISNPGGLLVVVVPDARLHRILARVRQITGSKDPFWMNSAHQPIVAVDPPYHLTCFEPRTLRLLLERCGYRILKIANAPVISNPQLWKQISKLSVAALGKSLELLSVGRFVIGYSTIAIARKQ